MILKKIVEYKKEFVKERMRSVPLSQVRKTAENAPQTHDFRCAIEKKGAINLIAEIKRASPSAGMIREDFDHIEIARQYESNNAAAISILTDEKFFQGSDSILEDVRRVTDLPILRKEFIIDEYQIYEARAIGADAVLLIASVLERSQLGDFIALGKDLGLVCLTEVHTEKELEKACMSRAEIIGINNRDLDTFTTDIATTKNLMNYIPDEKIIVSESGIKTPDDVKFLNDLGVDAVLVGETLMRRENPGEAIRDLLSFE